MDSLLAEIKRLPPPESVPLLKEWRAKISGSIPTEKKRRASQANAARLVERWRQEGVSDTTRRKQCAAQQARRLRERQERYKTTREDEGTHGR